LGFAKGNNRGVQFAIDNDIQFEYILFSNNDIYINDGNLIQELLIPFNSFKNIGIVGPEIIGLNGERQSPEPYYPYFYRTVGRYVFSKIPSSMKKYFSDYSRSAKSGEHYKVMGSFFLMSKIAFETIGGFDENTFLYGEEVILSEKLNSKKMTVFFNSKTTVVHAHSVTISNKFNSLQKFKLQYNSEKYYYRKYRKIGLISILLADLFTWIYIKLKYN
jgi:N-acetylglucosaminyl-diphospho-decaprenol L-rhamnosyltransferase